MLIYHFRSNKIIIIIKRYKMQNYKNYKYIYINKFKKKKKEKEERRRRRRRKK
jgi:hypothetical protein